MSITLLIIASLLGGSLIFLKDKFAKFSIAGILSFSGSFLLGICLIHLLPEIFSTEVKDLGIFLLIGFFLQLILDYFSGGIEHGHTHVNQKRIGHFPYLVFLSLCLHAFLEAVPIEHMNEHNNHSLLIALSIHKAPISFILASLLYAYRLKTPLIILGIVLFSLSAPLGAWLGVYLQGNETLLARLTALSAGIILHLSTTILLESNEQHKIQWKKLVPLVLGAGLALLSLI